jgi:hypothetical protein
MSTTTCFDLWISKGAYDIFALVINFLDENWQPEKVTISLFEVIETIGQALVNFFEKAFGFLWVKQEDHYLC